MKNLISISSVFRRKLTFTISPEDGPFFKIVEKFKLISTNSSVQLYFTFSKKKIVIEHLSGFFLEYLQKRFEGYSHINGKWTFINKRKLW